MLLLTLTSILLMAGTPVNAMTPTHDELSMITPAPIMRELQKRRGGRGGGGGGGGGYGGVAVDFQYPTTCGLIPHSLAVQNGLYGTDTSSAPKNTPFPIICNGLCAEMGNYLGCISYKTAAVPSTCYDYASTKTRAASCTSGAPCYWDMTCGYYTPYCNQNIYQGSITQFTCGTGKHAPIAMQTPIKMVPYTPVLANETSAATSTPEPRTFKKVISGWGLSLAGFVGICVAVGFVLFGAIGWCCWRKCRGRKANKASYKPVNYAKVETPTPYQQQSPAQSGVYHHQYQQPAPSYQQQQPLMGGYGHGQNQGYYQGYDQGYHNQYQHQQQQHQW